jgi:phosphoadenosine phosphosulfate reductase
MKLIEWDEAHQLFKFNPLMNWKRRSGSIFTAKGVPYNTLHHKGFISIGCAPCTRAVKEGEDFSWKMVVGRSI